MSVTKKVKAKLVARATTICLITGMLGFNLSAGTKKKPDSTPAQIATLPACGESLAASEPGIKGLSSASAAEPGAADPLAVPAGRYRMFPSQGIAAFVRPGTGAVSALYYPTDASKTPKLNNDILFSQHAWDSNGYGAMEIFATAGRITNPSLDDIAWASRREDSDPRLDGGEVSVWFADPHSLNPIHSVNLSYPLLQRQPNSSDYIAVAHADLDKSVGADNNYHDELVVAHVSDLHNGWYSYNLDVLNYAHGNMQNPEITHAEHHDYAPEQNLTPQKAAGGMLGSDNIIAVETGDFDGDGQTEVALVGISRNTFFIAMYHYVSVNGTHVLELANSNYQFWHQWTLPAFVNETGMADVGTLSIVGGDFDGDGKDELALGWAQWRLKDGKYSDYAVNLEMFKFDDKLIATVKDGGLSRHIGGLPDNSLIENARPRVQLIAGQFLFNPPSIPFGQKQLIVAWNDTGGTAAQHPGTVAPSVHLEMFKYSHDLTPSRLPGMTIDYRDPDFGMNKLYSVTAGGYQGVNTGQPLSSVAIGYWAGLVMTNATRFGLAWYSVDQQSSLKLADRLLYPKTSEGIDTRARLPVVAFDKGGRSLYLGPPMHATMYGVPTTEYILQEPPKHAFWDDVNKKVENYTRFDGNNVHLSQSNTASLTTTSKDQASWSMGSSTSASASATVQAGGNFGIVKASVEATAASQAKAGYDYAQKSESYNSQYKQQTISSSGQTNRDDYLVGKTETFDIWRYRIFDSANASGTNAFYEIVMPGQSYQFRGGGLNFAWYQPIQENGNILSYPAKFGSSDAYLPDDLKAFKLANGKEMKTPIVPASVSYFDGNNGSQSLDYESGIENGSSFSSSHTLAESLDFKTSTTGSVKAFASTGAGYSVCGSFEMHNNNSWGGSATSTETTKSQASITLNKSRGSAATSYPFYSVIYFARDGTTRMTFAVPNPALQPANTPASDTYSTLYGGYPDPALNLPLRFSPKASGSGELESWAPNLDADRKRMRGLLFRHADKDPASGAYELFAFNPKAGEKVRIEPRVYNFSTARAAIGTVVSFQVIPYDGSTNNEVCPNPINAAARKVTGLICPRSARTVLGTSIVPYLNPLQFTCLDGMDNAAVTGCAAPVHFDWDTTGFGPAFGTAEFRVYVVLNPDKQGGTENYSVEPEPLQITTITNKTPLVVTAAGYRRSLSKGDYVTIGGVRGLDEANGKFIITPISDTDFELNGTSASLDPYQGGGTISLIDPGQNNEGYATIGISTVPAVNANGAAEIPHDYLTQNSLMAASPSGVGALVEGTAHAQLNVPMTLRFTAYSNLVHIEQAHMLLYEGDPEAKGAYAIADQFVHPGENGPEGSSIWFNWTPTKVGKRHLYAVLLEDGGAKIAAKMTVNVKAD